jgi:Zn-dependent M32 family carboxypeptidase
MNLVEMVAEKIRASLTRKDPAIRDFFDIRYIKNNSDFDFTNEKFKEIVELKLKEVEYKYSLEENYNLLIKQIETDLKPVLNEISDFNFEEIYKFILTFKKK